MTRFLLVALAALLATGASAQTTTGIFVGNQGLPASLTYIDRSAGTAQQLPVQLSGFLQGIEAINGRLYVTGNGTRLDVIDVATRQRVAQITDPAFPTARYIAQATPSTAYVTTQNYSMGATTSLVIAIDLTTNTVAARITVPTQPEGIAVAGGRVYFSTGAFGTTTNLVTIDPATNTVGAPIDIGCSARQLFADDDGELFAVCKAEIVRLDAATGTVTGRTAADAVLRSSNGIGQDATLARAQPGGEQTLYVLTKTGILAYSTDAHTVSARIEIPEAATRGLSAIGYDPERNQFVLGRPDPTTPFSAAGTVTIHGTDGALVANYPAGIFPTYVSVITAGATAIANGPDASGLRLEAPAPNPATASATIRFTLDAPSDVSVSVVDVLGREVAQLASGAFGQGEHRATADVRGLPAGVYVVRLTAGTRVATRRLTVAR